MYRDNAGWLYTGNVASAELFTRSTAVGQFDVLGVAVTRMYRFAPWHLVFALDCAATNKRTTTISVCIIIIDRPDGVLHRKVFFRSYGILATGGNQKLCG